MISEACAEINEPICVTLTFNKLKGLVQRRISGFQKWF